MSYYADESDAYNDRYDDAAIEAAELDALRDRVITDYLAAREALKRIHHRMSQPEVFAAQDRFHRAEVALRAEQDHDLHMAPANQAMLAEIRGAAK